MKTSHVILLLGLILLAPFATASAQAPALSPIADVTLNAGTTTTINVVAVDESGRQITIAPSLPSFATLNSPTIGSGVVVTTLTLAPTDIHVGSYMAAVTATAGGASDTEIFEIIVNPAGSARAPLVTAPALQEVTAQANLSFVVSVADPDAAGIESLLVSGLPSGATFTPNAENTSATFSWTPNLGDAGEYDVRFTATALNGLSGGAATHIHVASAPVLMIDPIDDVTVEGGSSISVPVSASAMPDAEITVTAALPSFATLNQPGTGTGTVNTTITVSPPTGSAGTYHASVTATSEGEFVTEAFDIIVTGSGGGENHAPVLSAPASATVEVGSMLSFDVTAVDPDGDHVDLYGTALPPGATFLDHGDNSGTFTWSPIAGQAGTYMASFSGLDNRGGSGSASTEIVVTGGTVENRPPTLTAPETEEVDEGVLLSFTVTATDPDGDPVMLTADELPDGAMFSDQGDNSGVFTWTPDFGQAGTYEVAFTGDDGQGGTGTASTEILVTGVVVENHPPILSAPETEEVDEGVLLSFTVTATDPDGDPVALTADELPEGAMFSDQGDNSGVFSWTPDFGQAGVYEVAFTGDDGQGGSGTASTVITVGEVEVGGTCRICGRLEICPGRTTKLCGPRRADSYSWTGPDGFTADTRCITVGVEGTYELTVVEDGQTSTCSATVRVKGHHATHNCPRGPGFWMAQCAQRGNGSTKFDRAQMDEITACIDDASDFFDWSDDFEEFCAIVDPPRPMDMRKQALRMYAVMLANVCAGELGIVGHHGESVSLDPSTRIDCDGVDGANTIAELITEADARLADLDGKPLHDAVKRAYGRMKDCMDAISNGKGIGPTCGPHGHSDWNGDGSDITGVDGDEGRVGDADTDGNEGPSGDPSVDGNEGQSSNASAEGNDAVARGGQALGLNPNIGPNPLNPSTELSFGLSREGRVHVAVYDLQGRLVKTLLDEIRAGGEQRVVWDGSNARNQRVPSGVYFFRIDTPDGSVTEKVAVVK